MEFDTRVLLFLGFALWATQGRFLSLLFLELGMSEREVGTIFAVPTFINAFSPIFWGFLADKVLDWRTVLTICSVGGTAVYCLLLLPQLRSFGYILAIRSVHSVLLSGILPVMDGATLRVLDHQAKAAGILDDDKVARRAAYGKSRVYGTISWGLIHLTLGLLFNWFPYLLMVPISVVTLVIFVGYVWICNPPNFQYQPIAPEKSTEDITSFRSIYPGQEVKLDEMSKERVEGVELELAELPQNSISTKIEEGFDSRPAEVIEEDVDRDEARSFQVACKQFLSNCLRPFSLTFILTIMILSVGQSQVESLVFIFFREDMNASNLLLGISVVVTVSFEIPLFAVGPQLLKRFGPAWLMVVGMFCYSSRVLVYTLINENTKWLILLVEPLHGVTFTTTQLASVIFVSKLTPDNYQNFAQGFLAALRSAGSGVGVLLGSWAMASVGSHVLYRVASIVIGINAVIFFTVFRFLVVFSVIISL